MTVACSHKVKKLFSGAVIRVLKPVCIDYSDDNDDGEMLTVQDGFYQDLKEKKYG